jgi:hypothetical protein
MCNDDDITFAKGTSQVTQEGCGAAPQIGDRLAALGTAVSINDAIVRDAAKGRGQSFFGLPFQDPKRPLSKERVEGNRESEASCQWARRLHRPTEIT